MFELPEYPGITFSANLRFHGETQCELRVEVSGAACDALDLHVTLSVRQGHRSLYSQFRPSQHAITARLVNGGFVAHRFDLPQCTSSAASREVICHVELERISPFFEVPPFKVGTTC